MPLPLAVKTVCALHAAVKILTAACNAQSQLTCWVSHPFTVHCFFLKRRKYDKFIFLIKFDWDLDYHYTVVGAKMAPLNSKLAPPSGLS